MGTSGYRENDLQPSCRIWIASFFPIPSCGPSKRLSPIIGAQRELPGAVWGAGQWGCWAHAQCPLGDMSQLWEWRKGTRAPEPAPSAASQPPASSCSRHVQEFLVFESLSPSIPLVKIPLSPTAVCQEKTWILCHNKRIWCMFLWIALG